MSNLHAAVGHPGEVLSAAVVTYVSEAKAADAQETVDDLVDGLVEFGAAPRIAKIRAAMKANLATYSETEVALLLAIAMVMLREERDAAVAP